MICCHCQCSFTTNSELLRHIKLSHASLSTFTCQEGYCQRSFSSFSSFASHRNRKHSGKPVSTHEIPAEEATHDDLINLNVIDFSDSSSDTSESSDIEFFNLGEAGDCEGENDTEITEKESDVDSAPNLTQDASNVNTVVSEKALYFVSKLYNFHEIPRNRIQDIIVETDRFVSEIVDIIRDRVNQDKTSNASVSSLELGNVFRICATPFHELDTEHKRFKIFKKHGTFIHPVSYILGEREEFKLRDNVQVMEKVQVAAQFIPMKHVLKIFFEIPNMFDETIEYLSQLNGNTAIVSNFVQGSLWKSFTFGDRTVFPLFIYFDDYENNNPLGSHKGIAKSGAVYLSIPCLPPKYQSKVENIFLYVLFNTLDRQIFKNPTIFTKLIDELNFLENQGITINLKNTSKQIFFRVALILGDNLGLHSILGFTESFNANYFCRFCLTKRSNIHNIFHERDSVLRDCVNYDEHLELKNVTETGIKERCIFHDLNFFHVTKNLSVDVMHDLLEGICPYDLALILHQFIKKDKFFTLAHLNDRIRGFDYGSSRNKPAEITDNHLKTKRLAMSSAEMLSLVRHLCTILGDLVPADNEHWQLLKLLKQIIEVCVSSALKVNSHHYLNVIIAEYLSLLCKLFPGSMKPKHHFLVHYPRILESVGVLWKISSMRYESKHHEGKTVSHTAISRLNVCHTIAVREQLKLNHRLLYPKPPAHKYAGKIKVILLKMVPNGYAVHQMLQKDLNEYICTTKWIRYNRDIIKQNTIIMLPSEEGAEFYLVDFIVLTETSNFTIVAKKLLDCYFDDHYQAYVILDQNCYNWQCLSVEDLEPAVFTHFNKLGDGLYYITKKWI